jgi:DnaK suppressor protein
MMDTTTRNADLRQMLRQHRREMQHELQSRIRDGRAGQPTDGYDDFERTDMDTQGDIRFALLELRAETLTRIDEALARLDVGEYGTCFECGGQITDRRLRAAPFAVRCRACELQREQAHGHARQLAQRHGGLVPLDTALGFSPRR